MSDLFLTPTDPTRADSPAPEFAMKSVPACIGGFPIVVPDDAYMSIKGQFDPLLSREI